MATKLSKVIAKQEMLLTTIITIIITTIITIIITTTHN